MKSKTKLFLSFILLFSTLSLASCKFKNNDNNSGTVVTPTDNNNDDNNNNSDNNNNDNNDDNNNNGDNNKDDSNDDDQANKTYSITNDNYSLGTSDYDTGCYGSSTIDNYTIYSYRATQKFEKNNSFVELLADHSVIANEYKGLDGSLYNESPFGSIKSFTISYTRGDTNTVTNKTNPHVRFGKDISCNDYTVELTDTTLSTKNITISENTYNYFRIETGSYDLYISNISLTYKEESTSYTSYVANSGSSLYRFNPVHYDGTLEAGSSQVTVPVDVTYNEDGTYVVNKTKTLTYYTYSYVQSNTSCANEAALTDPFEICAYFNAFGVWPANYVLKNNYSKAYSIFGNKTRCYSSYTRTDGYATSVPYRNKTGNNYPQYYELDIALLESYSSSSRGVGRIVAWQYGFNSNGYDTNPVCVYTDDHYFSFQEYLNNGTFSKRFNVTGNCTPSTYSPATTLTYTEEVKIPPSIEISGPDSVAVGETITLTANIENSTSSCTWESSDTTIATVDSNGVVTPNSSITKNTSVTISVYLNDDTSCSTTKTITITVPSTETGYQLLSDTSQLYDGLQFIIVDENLSVCAATYNKSYFGTADITASDSQITVVPEDCQLFTLKTSTNGWYILDSNSKYVCTSKNKELTLSSDATSDWTISFSGNNATITSNSVTGSSIKYNSNNGTNSRFTNYTSSLAAIRMYAFLG